MLEINSHKLPTLSDNFFKVKEDLCGEYQLDADNKQEIQMLFSELNPFFKDGVAHIEVIEDKARAVIFHRSKKTALFGYFESIHNSEVCRQLLTKCEKWAKEQGIEKLIGPINFNTYHQYRICLSPQENLFFNEPKNPPYYASLLKENGYKVLNEYQSYIVENKQKIINWYKQYEDKRALLNFDSDYEYIPLTAKVWIDHLEELHQKSELTFSDNFAYEPIGFNLFRLKYGENFSKLICPHTSLLVKNKSEGIVGIMINFPNFLESKESKTLLLKTIGLLPAHRKMGYHILRMLLEIAPHAIEKYDKYIFCLMQKDNYPSKLGREFMDKEKEYALFCKEL